MTYYAPHPKLAREEMRNRSAVLRRDQTLVEKRLWYRLRAKRFYGIKFRRQHPIGPYIVDFCSPMARIIIELDGGQHADNKEYDEKRTRFLEQYGFRVIRFWDPEVWNNMEGVLTRIGSEMGMKPFAATPPCQKDDGRVAPQDYPPPVFARPTHPLSQPLPASGERGLVKPSTETALPAGGETLLRASGETPSPRLRGEDERSEGEGEAV